MQIKEFYGSHTRQKDSNSNSSRCFEAISIRLVIRDVTGCKVYDAVKASLDVRLDSKLSSGCGIFHSKLSVMLTSGCNTSLREI